MIEIDKLVALLAQAYLNARGDTFTHLGVRLPLATEPLKMAIQNYIVAAHLENAGAQQGQADALLMLSHMVCDDELTPLGALVMDELHRAFCADVRQMLEEGKDPMAELENERCRGAVQ